MGMLTVKMQWFERRAPGLTFGTTLITSSAPVALGAASQKLLTAVRKYRQSTGKRPQLHWKQLWQSPQGSALGGMETLVGHAALSRDERRGAAQDRERIDSRYLKGRAHAACT